MAYFTGLTEKTEIIWKDYIKNNCLKIFNLKNIFLYFDCILSLPHCLKNLKSQIKAYNWQEKF